MVAQYLRVALILERMNYQYYNSKLIGKFYLLNTIPLIYNILYSPSFSPV
jgi:hypothetical protein